MILHALQPSSGLGCHAGSADACAGALVASELHQRHHQRNASVFDDSHHSTLHGSLRYKHVIPSTCEGTPRTRHVQRPRARRIRRVSVRMFARVCAHGSAYGRAFAFAAVQAFA
eukprot:6172534-Pleurochrysis_carterae.AAC.2